MIGRARKQIPVGAGIGVLADHDEIRIDVRGAREVEIEHPYPAARAQEWAQPIAFPEIIEGMNPDRATCEIATCRARTVQSRDIGPAESVFGLQTN